MGSHVLKRISLAACTYILDSSSETGEHRFLVVATVSAIDSAIVICNLDPQMMDNLHKISHIWFLIGMQVDQCVA